ncbi:MAG: hypothetical protein NUW23_03550 [Firmicutes bacterium]|jgi:hypothetical protein|nr:hypothetical protein [Bacillota bacterium]
MTQGVLNAVYRCILLGLLAVLAWNTLSLQDCRRQVMSAKVMIPLLLRFLNIK